MPNRTLLELKNIGKTVAYKLHELGVSDESELKKMGSVNAYRCLSRQSQGKRLPVCYYLYSLEGAIQNKHWNELSDQEKADLRRAAGLTK
jgi:DNA transformation protein